MRQEKMSSPLYLSTVNKQKRNGLHLLFYRGRGTNKLNDAIEKCYDLNDFTLSCIEEIKKSISLVAKPEQRSLRRLTLNKIALYERDTFLNCLLEMPEIMQPEILFARISNTDFSEELLSNLFETLYARIVQPLPPVYKTEDYGKYKESLTCYRFLLERLMNEFDRYEDEVKLFPLNKRDEDGNTPLHYASKTGASYPLIAYLIDLGASCLILNKQAQSPQEIFDKRKCRCKICGAKDLSPLLARPECATQKLLNKPIRMLEYLSERIESIKEQQKTTDKWKVNE